MGVPGVKKAQKPVKVTLPNGNDVNVSEKDNKEITTKEEKEENGGCCQGVNGFSCCRDETENEVKKSSTMSKVDLLWKKWGHDEIVTTAVVVGGLVVSVGVIYSFYKRSR